MLSGEKMSKEDQDFDKVIVKDRNDAVLHALDEELAKPGTNRVLIPWGEAHQDGLQAGLKKRGFKAEHDEWLRAFAVKNVNPVKATDWGFRWQIPYVTSIRVSDTTTDLSAVLSLFAYTDSPKIQTHSSAWGLLHNRVVTADRSDFSLLAGLLWTSESRSAEHTERQNYALLGLYGHTHTPTRDGKRFGWWGFLGGAATERDAEGIAISHEWHLPFAFGKNHPLLYGRSTDEKTGNVTHRFLGFFEAKSVLWNRLSPRRVGNRAGRRTGHAVRVPGGSERGGKD